MNIAVGVLSDAELAVFGVFFTVLGGIVTTIVNGVFDLKKTRTAKKNEQHEKEQAKQQEKEQEQKTSEAAIQIERIRDEKSVREELWEELRRLRKDYNTLSLAYIELNRKHAANIGEIRYLKLEAERLRSLDKELEDHKQELEETRKRLKQCQIEYETLRTEAEQLRKLSEQKRQECIALQERLNALLPEQQPAETVAAVVVTLESSGENKGE